MIIEQELKTIELSPVKKDFYQIWNEILDVAKKISARWDPTSTNESDPGIVLLKVLTALCDKLNYNIDKDILEVFMPSATQEDSMRKLCEMLGYNMKYYQSATTAAVLSYNGTDEAVDISIPMFTTLSDVDNNIIYTTIEPGSLFKTTSAGTANKLYDEVHCIEGSHQICMTNNNEAIIYYSALDDNFRYYLPETMIAENGIFVYDYVETQTYATRWAQVENLNTQPGETKCYKFGFDSRLRVPYLQFPEDAGKLMTDGIEIHYIRTTGVNGNIAARTLEHINETITNKISEADVTSNITVTNLSAAMNGKNPETITQAYNSFKKTIGTFDTLVACRDYMNKIYNLFNDVTNIPLVSNIMVADIRNDINRAFTLCELDTEGIKYVNKKVKGDRISNFDLVLYPFKTIYGTNTKTEYEDSFSYTEQDHLLIEAGIEKNKTLAHNIIYPEEGDITCIKNYLKLNAKITTTTKVNAAEEKNILGNIYTAISAAFNAREVDFGEEIPFDSILQVIEQADARIKNVALDEPELYVAVQTKTATGIKETILTGTYADPEDELDRKQLSNKLVLRNILAGKVAAFDYDTSFLRGYNEQAYEHDVAPEYPEVATQKITKLTSECALPVKVYASEDDYTTLTDHEVVSFRAPNFKTTYTYPAYVNYFLHLDSAAHDTGELYIAKDADYQLKTNEWIAFNYTSSSKDEEGQSSETIINKTYLSGVIIRPNIQLWDSSYNKIAHTPSKKSGYDFEPGILNIINAGTAGMFTFGPNDQVEIRERAGVSFNSPSYLYWTLSPTTADPNGTNLGSRFVDGANKYILEENEYFYYTDAAQVSMAYYGQGTEIVLNNVDPNTLKLPDNATEIPADKIASMQLRDIPWKYLNLTNNTYIFLQEYQYINLTKGDKVSNIFTNTPATLLSTITNTWTAICNAGTFTPNCQYEDKTAVVLPSIAVGDVGWEVRSKLEFDMGPELNQTLRNTYDRITAIGPDSYSQILAPTITDTTPAVTIPLALKSNYRIQKGADTLDVSVTDASGAAINDFKINTCYLDGSNNYVKLNNKSNYWTELTATDITAASNPYILHINMPATEKYGLIAFKNNLSNSAITLTAYKAGSSVTTLARLTQFNAITTPSYVDTINISAGSFMEVQLQGSAATPGFDLRLSTAGTDGTVLFGQLDIVKGINPQLDYQVPNVTVPTAAEKEAQLLSDIRDMDDTVRDNFYYNTLLDNSTAIDIDKDGLLTDPKYSYDYNNINNKFVISEIDYDEMKDGITIARSSKL